MYDFLLNKIFQHVSCSLERHLLYLLDSWLHALSYDPFDVVKVLKVIIARIDCVFSLQDLHS